MPSPALKDQTEASIQRFEGTPGESVPPCSPKELFRLLGRTHAMAILHIFIFEEPRAKRFIEVQNRLSISPSTLSARLKELVATGLLSRTVYNEIPPRVDYEATSKAHELVPVFDGLVAWTQRNSLRSEDEELKIEAVQGP